MRNEPFLITEVTGHQCANVSFNSPWAQVIKRQKRTAASMSAHDVPTALLAVSSETYVSGMQSS